MKKTTTLVEALQQELAAKQAELDHHRLALEQFQESLTWRSTAPVRWVVNQVRRLRHDGRIGSLDDQTNKGRSSDSVDALAYFTGMCRISLEGFFTKGATLEFPNPEQSTMSGVLRELLVKTREIEEQKWLLAKFKESPAWRCTAPLRWVATHLSGSGNGSSRSAVIDQGGSTADRNGNNLSSAAAQESKAYFSELCRTALANFLSSNETLEFACPGKPVVSIILVLFNRAELTFACLRSIALHAPKDAEVVIVDNDSQDETSRLLERINGARIIRNSTNRHFLAAANQASRECQGDYILLLNNDAHLIAGAIDNALETLRSSPDIGAVGGKIILIDGTLQEAGSIVWKDGSCAGYGRGDDPFAPMYSFRRDVDYCSGAFLLTPRALWEQLGGFDPAFEPAYYEETDYCMRLRQHGFRVVYEPSATILHYEFASSKDAASATSLQAANHRVFAERHKTALQAHESPSAERILYARARKADRRILVIDDRIPHPWLGSGFPRAHALHEVLQRLGYFVTLYPIDVINEPWEQAYEDFPREVEVMMGMGRSLLELFFRVRQDYYDTVIVSRPHNMQLLAAIRKTHPEWFKGVRLLYDAEAVFAEREINRRQVMGNPMSDKEVRAALSSEISLAETADCVIAVSESEKRTFVKHGIRNVEVVGHSLDAMPDPTPFERREGFLFVGAVHKEDSPNADSLIWFLREVYPRIRQKLGDVPFSIVGLNRSERIREMAMGHARLMGRLSPESLNNLYGSAKIFVAPTRFAAGMPHKIHEAAARGLPVAATPLLAGQLGWTSNELAIGESADEFARACVDVYLSGKIWTGLRDAALKRVQRECSSTAFEQSVRRLVQSAGR